MLQSIGKQAANSLPAAAEQSICKLQFSRLRADCSQTVNFSQEGAPDPWDNTRVSCLEYGSNVWGFERGATIGSGIYLGPSHFKSISLFVASWFEFCRKKTKSTSPGSVCRYCCYCYYSFGVRTFHSNDFFLHSQTKIPPTAHSHCS